jgi:branched-chain amino acid transport system permease protein/urea transport system permease protein
MGVDYLLNSFFALVVGGMGSLLGLIVGVAFIGGIQSVISYYANQNISYFIVLALCIVFMRWKTNGIISRT